MYYAIVGDIVLSKSLGERREVQERLERYLIELNTLYLGDIKKRLAVTLGDEFQGLFVRPDHLLEIIHRIELEMFPTKMRFGIGIGEISFDHGHIDSPYKSDGEVWWNARKAIDKVKTRSSTNKLEDFSNIYIHGRDDALNRHLEAVFDLCYSLKINWTEKQRELISHSINEYGLNDTFSIKEVANQFNQSTSTIYEKYKAAKYLNYVHVMTSVTSYIEKEENGHVD